jgi:transposase-like protein
MMTRLFRCNKGLKVREIQPHLIEMFGTEASPTPMFSSVDAYSEDVTQWQSRPLDVLNPVVCLGCIHVKVRAAGVVHVKALYLVVGIKMECQKEVLGLCIAQTEGAKFWLGVVNELKSRGLFPNDEAFLKLFYLALNNTSKKWVMRLHYCPTALNRVNTQFEERMFFSVID